MVDPFYFKLFKLLKSFYLNEIVKLLNIYFKYVLQEKKQFETNGIFTASLNNFTFLYDWK